ncbi:hypothetical protein GWI33_012330 [Rhynchophorus ferrugineus]|uniref:RING-type E3 ubiquitin transferase BRCA1 n=1 Tax=Rhynchophorus ferrugineus TaxID=354439 RepID=A0A834MLU6_RHYFE|nr:hypothetical protein GWI33_012330 [Rhynchophorus ferrugineus]
MNSEKLIALSKLITTMKESVKCFICQDYIKNAAQIKCGHTFCDKCIKSQSFCPICQCVFSNNDPVFRDEFLNSLSKFIDITCQAIKEEYIEDVEVLQSCNNKDIAKITESAPRNIHAFSSNLNEGIIESKGIIKDGIDKVVQEAEKANNGLINKNVELMKSFNKNKHDSFTQNQDNSVMSFDNIQIVSVSQGNKGINHNDVVSQSLILPNKKHNSLKKPFHSFTENLSDSDNYAIIEVQSEDIVKQVERNVLQDILEDQCLTNLENIAKQNQDKESKRNSAHSFDSINLTSNFEYPGPSRLENVKKVLRIRKPKELKKLKIVKRRHNHNDSVKDTTRKSQKAKCEMKNLFKSGASIQNKENPIKANMKGNQGALKSISDNVIDLTKVNDYLKNINDKGVGDENVFQIATQKTAEGVEQRSYHFPPVSGNINDIDSLINILSENVNKLIEESTGLNDEVSLNLVTCFTNLKTYIKRLHQLNLEQKQEVHLIPNVKINISTQTKHVKNDKQTQTSQTSYNEMAFETLNNSQNCTTLTKTNSSKKEKESAIVNKVLKSIQPSNMNSAIDMKASQKTQSSVLLCSLKSTELRGPVKKFNRILFADDNVRKVKRIHQLSNDSCDENGHAKRMKLIRDDLTVEFQDSENTNKDQLNIDISENMDYDNYLLEVMEKYGTPQKRCTDNKNIPHNETTGKSDREKHQQNDENGLFSGSEKDQKSTNLSIAVNTECDIIENSPTVQPAKKFKFLESKSKNNKTTLNELHKQVLNKDSASNDKIVHDQQFSVLLQHDTSAEDALNIINNEKHILTEGFEEIQTKRKEEMQTSQKGLTQSIDEFLMEIEVDDSNDKEIERELKSINFTAELNKLNTKDNSKILILQNIKITESRIDRDNDIINISDDSETEVVETTPQKKKKSSFNRTPVVNLEQSNFDIFLPPPPGFGDDVEDTSFQPERLAELMEPGKNYQSAKIHNQSIHRSNETKGVVDDVEDTSLQPERLAELIEPGKNDQSANIHNQSIHRSNATKDVVDDLCTEIFSPIATSSQNTFKFNYPPLVNDSSPNIRKPNILSSTPNQKSILNYVNFSQNRNKFNKSKPCIMWSRISNKDIRNVFRQLELKRLITTSEHFTPKVTHLIVAVDEKGQLKSHTAKFLLAVAAGIWVVRWEWVINCLKMNAIVSEEPYEVLDISGVPGPQMSRLTKIKNPLFQEYIFFCAPTFSTISINDIENIVKMLGGEIADELNLLLLSKKIKIIITDTSATEDLDKFDEWLEAYKTVTVDIEWFIKCVAQYKLLSFRPFVLCSEDTIFDLNYPDVLVESVPFVLTETL